MSAATPAAAPIDLAALSSGIRWLYDTEQSDNAILQHHGLGLAAAGDRHYRFVPEGAYRRPVIVIDVAHPEWTGQPGNHHPLNPIGEHELADIGRALADLGHEVYTTWNGHPGITGSVCLKQAAHPSLVAAVQRYSAGCPEHPDKHVFCDCGWYAAGHALIVPPAKTEVNP